MRRPVQWSRDALDDLKNQIAYIAADNPDAARRVSQKILLAAASLGQRTTGRPGRVARTYERSVPRLPYVIAYAVRISSETEVVAILRVVHTARRWPPGVWPT